MDSHDRGVVGAMSDTTPPPTPSDVLLGRVILVLGLLGLVDLGGIIYLAARQVSIPDALVGTLGAAVTGLAAVLAGRRP